MSKNQAKAKTPEVKAPEVKASGAGGEYVANRAFAFKMERIERGAHITLTAEQALALGDTVTLIAPQGAQDMGEDKEQGQGGESAASTADGATGTEAANEDQNV